MRTEESKQETLLKYVNYMVHLNCKGKGRRGFSTRNTSTSIEMSFKMANFDQYSGHGLEDGEARKSDIEKHTCEH